MGAFSMMYFKDLKKVLNVENVSIEDLDFNVMYKGRLKKAPLDLDFENVDEVNVYDGYIQVVLYTLMRDEDIKKEGKAHE